MANFKPNWEEVTEFSEIAAQLGEKYPERFSNIDVGSIVAYAITNKNKPKSKVKTYEMSGIKEPESFVCNKTYFVKMYMSDWAGRSVKSKRAIVMSALERIDPMNPGDVKALDLRDQRVMVNTLGPNWEERDDIPDLLEDKITIRD